MLIPNHFLMPAVGLFLCLASLCPAWGKKGELSAHDLLNKAHWLNGRKSPEQAIEVVNRALPMAPMESKLYCERGDAHAALGDDEQAFKDYSKAIELSGGNSWYYEERAGCLERLHRLREALADYESAIRTGNKHFESRYQRGRIFVALGQEKNAIAELQAAIKLDTTDPRAHVALGKIYATSHQLDQAISEYSQAIKVDTKKGEYFEDRAALLIQKKSWKPAIDDLTEAIKRLPNSTRLLRMRAQAYESSGKHDMAQKDLAEIKGLEADFGLRSR